MSRKAEMIGGVSSAGLGMLSDLLLKIKAGSLTEGELEKFLNRKNPFEKPADLLAGWVKFWKDRGFQLDPSSLALPKPRRGLGRLLALPAGLTLNREWEICKERFACYSVYGDDLDRAISQNERDPKNGAYAIWVRGGREADEELKNLSAEQIAVKKIATETVLERLVHEDVFFEEKKVHLDLENISLCSGSRTADGGVPDARWFGDEFFVGACGVQDAFPRLRARAAVVAAQIRPA